MELTEKVMIQVIVAVSAGISGLTLLFNKIVEHFTKSEDKSRDQLEKIVLEREKNLMELTEAVVKTTQKFQVVLDKFIENSTVNFKEIKDDLENVKSETQFVKNHLDKFCDKMGYIINSWERK